MNTATMNSPCKTPVIHPLTKQMVVITGRNKRLGLRVSGGAYFPAEMLKLAKFPVSMLAVRSPE